MTARVKPDHEDGFVLLSLLLFCNAFFEVFVKEVIELVAEV